MGTFAKSFRALDIWKPGIAIAQRTYALTTTFPREEQYGMTAQMRRAAIALPANIAEGFRRRHRKEFKQSLHIALGSAAELETYCELCRELFDGYATEAAELLRQLDCFERMTNTMIGT